MNIVLDANVLNLFAALRATATFIGRVLRPEGPFLSAQAEGLGFQAPWKFGPERAIHRTASHLRTALSGPYTVTSAFPRPSAWADRIGPSGRKTRRKSWLTTYGIS
jgi:hypothetical protein